MKPLVFLLLIATLIPVAKAQKHNKLQTNTEDSWRHVYLTLSSKGVKNKQKSSFRSIEVVDYRPDTTRIGLFVTGEVQHEYRLKPSASGVISSFLNQVYANPAASKTLFVVIKNLWLSEYTGEKQLEEHSSSLRSRISFRADTYLREDGGYTPLAYFDTSITSSKLIRDIAPFRLPVLIDMFMEEMDYVNQATVNNKKRRILPLAFVDSFSRKSFSHPIYAADTLYKGVYVNFENFINNKPSAIGYEIKQEGNSPMTLHLKDENGKDYYSRKVWGFCDGQQVFIMIEGKLCPLIFQDYAWYAYTSKEFTVIRYKGKPGLSLGGISLPSSGSLPDRKKVKRKLQFLSIDIETGEIN